MCTGAAPGRSSRSPRRPGSIHARARTNNDQWCGPLSRAALLCAGLAWFGERDAAGGIAFEVERPAQRLGDVLDERPALVRRARPVLARTRPLEHIVCVEGGEQVE